MEHRLDVVVSAGWSFVQVEVESADCWSGTAIFEASMASFMFLYVDEGYKAVRFGNIRLFYVKILEK